jgi:hypothetical protein
MAATEYKFSIENDTKNAAVDGDRLKQDILACSSITTGLSYISSIGDAGKVWMLDSITTKTWKGHWDDETTYVIDDAVAMGGHAYVCIQESLNHQPPNGSYWTLMTGEIEALCVVMKAHTGEPLPNIAVVKITTETETSENVPIIAWDSPRESDKRPIIVSSPGREGSYTWITSRGDDPSPTPPASGRGDGVLSVLTFTEPDTKEVEIQFSEAMQLLGGNVYWRPVENWDFEDSWNLLIRLVATVATPNITNTGNCTLFDTQQGFNIIMPAAGDGTHDIDLEAAVPVPDGYSPVTGTGYGFWNVDRFWSEVVTPNAEAHGEFNFYDIPLAFYFCKNVSCGNLQGNWRLDPYKAEWISSKWTPIFKVTRVTAGSGKIGGHFHVYRPGAV